MEKISQEFGKHYLIELSGCNPDIISRVETVRDIFLEAAQRSKANVVNHFFHQFTPVGVSGVIVISESHFAVHTWPESSYAAADILSCGEMDVQTAIDVLSERFQASKIDVRVEKRGV